MCKPEIRRCLLKFLGANMVIVAPLTVALGIANLILTIRKYCNNNTANCPINTPLALTYVAVAIWAPIPIFFNGLGAIWIAARPSANNGWLCLLSFFNTVAFGPVIVVVSAMEVTKKFGSNVSRLPMDAMALYGIEITITVVGGVLFLHALAILYLNCCCTTCLQEEMENRVSAQIGRDVYVSSRPTVVPVVDRTQYPTPAEVNRMNIWSAYR